MTDLRLASRYQTKKAAGTPSSSKYDKSTEDKSQEINFGDLTSSPAATVLHNRKLSPSFYFLKLKEFQCLRMCSRVLLELMEIKEFSLSLQLRSLS